MTLEIGHRPYMDTAKIEKIYSVKDGTPVKYVCTSAFRDEAQAMDIYYRETPHPEFGNKYFGLFRSALTGALLICGADKIEKSTFTMIFVNGEWHYSQHRHDYYTIDDVSIDGGRSYLRLSGRISGYPIADFVVRNGVFERVDDE